MCLPLPNYIATTTNLSDSSCTNNNSSSSINTQWEVQVESKKRSPPQGLSNSQQVVAPSITANMVQVLAVVQLDMKGAGTNSKITEVAESSSRSMIRVTIPLQGMTRGKLAVLILLTEKARRHLQPKHLGISRFKTLKFTT